MSPSPGEPDRPGEPGEPAEPADPDRPAEPAAPDRPGVPGRPVDTHQPLDPDQPLDPHQPLDPYQPRDTHQPRAGDRPGELRDRLAALPTEAARPDLADLDLLPTAELARLMNAEDASVPAAVAAVLPRIAAVVDAVAARLAGGGRLVYAGAGTAGRLGVLDAGECPPTFGTAPGQVVGLLAGGPAALVASVEGAEDDRAAAVADLMALSLGPADALVGVSASGRTPYAVAAVRHARALGALTVGLACNPDSELAAAAEYGIEVLTGPELIAGSTRLKAGTAQKLVLNMVSTLAMVRLGKTYGNLMVDVRPVNDKLRARAHRLVAAATGAADAEVTAALAATGGEVKPAVLCLLADLDPATAAALLAAAGGRLREALAQSGNRAQTRNPEVSSPAENGSGSSTSSPNGRRTPNR